MRPPKRTTRPEGPGQLRDRGVSFVEILVAVVLLGLAVVATLTALRTTIVGSDVNKDHANAHAWLQAAADAVHAAVYEECDVDGDPDPLNEYQMVVDAVTVPDDWVGGTITVTDVDFWSIDGTSGLEAWGDVCQSSAMGLAGIPLQLQLVKIEVVGPEGFTKGIEVIRGE